MQRREYSFKFFNASEGQYANNLDPERPAATFQVTLIGAGAVLDNGKQQGTCYDGEQCTVSAAAGYTANPVGWYAHNRKTTKDIWLGRGACPSIVADNLQILNEELWNKILYVKPEITEGGNIHG